MEIVLSAHIPMNEYHPSIPNEFIQIYHYDGSILNGWPRFFNSFYLQLDGIRIADINHDNNLEIISKFDSITPAYTPCNVNEDCEPTQVCTSVNICFNMDAGINVFNSDGTNLSPWPIQFPTGQVAHSSIVLSDINSDQNPEIIIEAGLVSNGLFDQQLLYAFNNQGVVINNFPCLINTGLLHSLISGDINGDSQNEIVTERGPINNNCQIMDWNIANPYWYQLLSNFALANFDNNSNLEFAYSALTEFYLTDYLGNPLYGWPVYQPTPDAFLGQNDPIIADLFGDNNKEVILSWRSTSNQKRGLYIYNFDGTIVDGFPKFQNQFESGPVIVDDIDNDGHLEIISVSTNGTKIVVLKSPKTYNSSSVEWSRYKHDEQATGNYGFGKNCSDGTQNGQCSTAQLPKFCRNGQLQDDCRQCGCFDEVCLANNSCSGACFDSDANDDSAYVSGYAKGPNDDYSEVVNKRDECVGRSSLMEYGCTKSNKVQGMPINCPNGCSNGACINIGTPPRPRELKEIPPTSIFEKIKEIFTGNKEDTNTINTSQDTSSKIQEDIKPESNNIIDKIKEIFVGKDSEPEIKAVEE